MKFLTVPEIVPEIPKYGAFCFVDPVSPGFTPGAKGMSPLLRLADGSQNRFEMAQCRLALFHFKRELEQNTFDLLHFKFDSTQSKPALLHYKLDLK